MPLKLIFFIHQGIDFVEFFPLIEVQIDDVQRMQPSSFPFRIKAAVFFEVHHRLLILIVYLFPDCRRLLGLFVLFDCHVIICQAGIKDCFGKAVVKLKQ